MKKVIINNFLIILIFFFMIEIFLNIFGFSDLRGYGKEFGDKKKNVETIVFGKKVFLDEYGYRVPSKNFRYDESSKKIIFIGDSVLFGSGVVEQKTFAGKLRLKKNNISIINAGIAGNNISNFALDINNNHKFFNNKDFVIVLTLDDIIVSEELNNTINQNNSTKKNQKNNLFEKMKKNNFLAKVNAFLRSKSYTYLWIKGIITKPSKRYFYTSYNNYFDKNKIETLSNEILKLNKIKNEKKLQIDFVIIPYEFQTRNNCQKDLFLPQRKIKQILLQGNFTVIDFTNEFCNSLNPRKLYLNFDPVHLSVKGHNLIYDRLDKIIN